MKRAFVLVLSLTACGAPAAQSVAVEPAEEAQRPPQPPPEGELTDIAARHLIIAFYADVGEWAGEYAISQILETRFQPLSDETVEVHTRYYYRCLRPVCSGLPEGEDRRIFYFARESGRWRVVRMGDHMSAVF